VSNVSKPVSNNIYLKRLNITEELERRRRNNERMDKQKRLEKNTRVKGKEFEVQKFI
jgi:hypothetical protein